MKFKIIKANKEGWWYNNHIGEEFEITAFSYYKNGANHKLEIKNLKQFQKALNKYGPDFHINTSGTYYGPIYGGSSSWQILIEDTNYKELLLLMNRENKINKVLKNG